MSSRQLPEGVGSSCWINNRLVGLTNLCSGGREGGKLELATLEMLQVGGLLVLAEKFQD